MSNILGFDFTYTAGEALTINRVVVVGGTARHCNLPSAAKVGRILGVTQEGAASGSGISVRKYGISKVIAGATIAAGDELEIASSAGTVQPYTNGESNGRVGYAEVAAVSGDVFDAFIMPIDLNDILT